MHSLFSQLAQQVARESSITLRIVRVRARWLLLNDPRLGAENVERITMGSAVMVVRLFATTVVAKGMLRQIVLIPYSRGSQNRHG